MNLDWFELIVMEGRAKIIRKVDFNGIKRNVNQVGKCSVETTPWGLLESLYTCYTVSSSHIISFQSPTLIFLP